MFCAATVFRSPKVLLLRDRLSTGVLIAALSLRAVCAHAGHPMLSEDTGTQGSRNFELELGQDWSRLDGLHVFLFQPQLSIGASPTFDLIVQPSWLRESGSVGEPVQGLGDTNVDFKWRFFGAAPLSLGVRAGLELPTAQHGLGLRPGHIDSHAILVGTIDTAPWTVDMNAGYSHDDSFPTARSDLFHFSVALLYSLSARTVLVFDTAADTNPDETQPSWMGVVLFGAIYTVRPGLDVDAGFRAPLNPGAPAQQWLVGITYRGAL
jgi:hypothetical protein